MLRIPEQIPEKHGSHFSAYETAWPSIEKRREGAIQLASSPNDLPDKFHFGRNFLLSVWGDEEYDLQRTACFMYTVRDALGDNVGQPVIVLSRGWEEDILAREDDLEEDVRLDYGTIGSDGFRYSFQGNLRERGRTRMGLTPPYLGFGLMAQLLRPVRVEVDVIGQGQVGKLPEDRPTPLAIGTVSLKDDVYEYRKTRHLDKRHIILGKEACHTAIEHLAAKARDPELRHHLTRLAEAK